MAIEHTFLGTWEIEECTLNGKLISTGLEGIKFRLDEIGDITWYNDSRANETSVADELFACETFEISITPSPCLIFTAFSGHFIEFKTAICNPGCSMTLFCDGWYTLLCKRLKENQSIGHLTPFTFLPILQENIFADSILKSSDGLIYNVHSAILRLNGFDCNKCERTDHTNGLDRVTLNNSIKITVDPAEYSIMEETSNVRFKPYLMITPNFLCPPAATMMNLSSKLTSNFSNSFNCLASLGRSVESRLSPKFCSNSSSDSNLQNAHNRNIFTFNELSFAACSSNDVCKAPTATRPPLSPYKIKSPVFPSPFDTPPSSPLTPISSIQNLPASLLVPIIHFLYSECLPNNLDQDLCSQLISFASSLPPLTRMVEPCKKYLKLIKLKIFIIDTILNIHHRLNNIIRKINPDHLSRDPKTLVNTFFESLTELALGFAKLMQFSNIFVRNASDITRYQRHEIIKYVRSRLAIILSQLHQILQNILVLLRSLTSNEISEVVVYLVPEIEKIIETITTVLQEVKISLEIILSSDVATDNEYIINESKSDLKQLLHKHEKKMIDDFYQKISILFDIVKEKRCAYIEMSEFNKEVIIRQNLHQLIAELPSYIEILEHMSDNIESKIGWKEFKCCFKVATSQINGIIANLILHKDIFKKAIDMICNLVQRDEFNSVLGELNILNCEFQSTENSMRSLKPPYAANEYKSSSLNLTRILNEPPNAAQSSLSKHALRLLHSGQLADMEFEVTSEKKTDNYEIDMKNGINENCKFMEEDEVHTFKAHRIIVAARCEWFKKALSSGMQESITRKIQIHDTSPVIFRRLLLYLYGAPIDKTVGAEQLCELLLLADRYSLEELKDLCETTLKSQIDDNSVLCLLSIADRFNAVGLKATCLSHISHNKDIISSEMFREMPVLLQQEVQDLIRWCGRIPEPWCNRTRSSRSNSSSRVRSRKSSPSYM